MHVHLLALPWKHSVRDRHPTSSFGCSCPLTASMDNFDAGKFRRALVRVRMWSRGPLHCSVMTCQSSSNPSTTRWGSAMRGWLLWCKGWQNGGYCVLSPHHRLKTDAPKHGRNVMPEETIGFINDILSLTGSMETIIGCKRPVIWSRQLCTRTALLCVE